MNVLITGSGGYAGIGFTRCLRKAPDDILLIGSDADSNYVIFSETDKKVLIPRADSINYLDVLKKIIKQYSIDFIHAQPDIEVKTIAENMNGLNSKVLLPNLKTINICQNKFETYRVLNAKGIPVAKTVMLNDETDVIDSLKICKTPMWLRAVKGAGGKGCFLVNGPEEAKIWIDFHNGWGNFSASEYLPGKNYGCDMLFKDGDLIYSQVKLRLQYVLHKANPLGISGTTGVLQTLDRKDINYLAHEAVSAIDDNPNGVFSVDFKENDKGKLNITEINPGRFLSSSLHLFYKTGFLLPYYYVLLAFDKELPPFNPMNPIKENTMLVRQVDAEPQLISKESINSYNMERNQNGYSEIS